MNISNSKIVAIHQPNFFPWLGYFNKIALADIFIVMDNVQFPKTGGTWSNRVKLLVNNQATWVTMPIERNYHGTRNYREMLINNQLPWRTKFNKTLQLNYNHAPFYAQVFPWLAELINYQTESLVEYNFWVINSLLTALNINSSKLVLGSTLTGEGQATELLISMTKSVGGTAYLCGGGASGYQEDEKFTQAGIELVYQSFQHPHYPQYNQPELIPGLSIIDSLMNCGFEETSLLVLGQEKQL